MHYLSGYRIMWLLVMFDLPTITKEEQRAATQFRNHLLEPGFSMAQYSVYTRVCSREKADVLSNSIEAVIPSSGKVQIFSVTDKQYGNSLYFLGRVKKKIKSPEQYLLFE
ncbi:MAG: CRISPR-associated endonuclease Cas2 [Desulfovibrionaceae bacterium]